MHMNKVAELNTILGQNEDGKWVGYMWDQWNTQRMPWLDQKSELQKFLFATDTTTTSNSSLPWKNKTTLPKLTQIRDNLHSNYLSALFPNDKWLKWTAFTQNDASHKKAKTITSYMENKTRLGGLKQIASRLLYDYIDYGNAFAMPAFEKRYHEYKPEGSLVPSFIGPKAVRVSPLDIVFNPMATSFRDSPKIVRSVKTVGELKRLAQTAPEQAFWEKAVKRREFINKSAGGFSKEDWSKAEQLQVDGFGNLYDYYQSGFVEILEFYGDFHDQLTGELQVNQMITVVDRCLMVRQADIPTYDGAAPIFHVGWRLRPDNLWAMGPLDNLVGMQYRIDHLENLKADAMDLTVHPMYKVKGEVEEFTMYPGAQIMIDENGDVEELGRNLGPLINADNQIELLEARMELYAGAPREAMGVRSPGEKTALEVQTLSNAAGRIFQEKINTFETEMMEPLLNAMLEVARRNFDEMDVISTLDNDLGATEFLEITKEDIIARGVIRPIGARHFAQQAQDLQNLVGISSSPLWALVAPHTSGKNLTKFIEDSTSIHGYEIFRPNVAVMEQQETQGLMNQAAEDLEVSAAVPAEPTTVAPPTGV